MARRNPGFMFGALALLGTGAAVGLYVLSRVHRRNAVLQAAGLPPGAALREVTADELARLNARLHVEEPEAPTWVGAFLLKRQFASESSTGVTVNGERWGLIEESALPRLLAAPSPQTVTSGVSGFISGI